VGGQRRPGHPLARRPGHQHRHPDDPGGTQPDPAGRRVRIHLVANQTEQTISRRDARTGQPQATIPTPNLWPRQLAVGAGSVWAIAGSLLVRIDPATNKAVVLDADWELVEGGLTVAGGRVWLSGTTPSGVQPVVRVDPATNRKADTVPTGADGALAVGGGSVWQADSITQSITRLDPRSGRTLAQIPVGVVAKHLTAEDGSLWVGSDSGRVTRIDMATNKVTGTFQVSGRAPAVAAGFGSVWIVDTAHAALLRLQPG
jgi:streptogramin lyase